jgi:protein-S-isoprenylcysteine O-methyltransferase Ste14
MFVHAPQIGILLLPTVLHELLVAASFLIRRPLNRQSKGWKPPLVAYIGTFLVMAFIRFSAVLHPNWVAQIRNPLLNMVGFASWTLGTLFGLYSLWYFRHAFSLVPQARTLVTSGPFRIARHPIYLSYVLQYLGIWLTRPTITFGSVLAVWFAVMIVRIGYEEALLADVYPEYLEYKSRVRAFYPTLPRRVVASKPGSSMQVSGK